ncbi:MAG: serine hydrolase domain-containing protein [Chloroflexota bacterium]
MPKSLPRSTPVDQGVDPAGILAFLDALAARPDIEMHSLMLVRHGHVVAEGWWHPYSADRPHRLYSLSKSFTSTAASFAAAEGLLDLDDTILSHFPEFEAEITDPGSRSMRIRDVAAMASGHEEETIGQTLALDSHEPVRGFLLLPPDRPPGTVFAYNQPCTYTLGSIVQREAGMSLSSYLRPRLFDPLGIGQVGWQAFPNGREQGYTGLHARTEDIAKLGQLYLQRGQWDGAQLISEEWIAQATSKQVDNSMRANPDWQQGYGFQFWMSRHGYRGDGAFGQFCVILPEQNTVMVTTAATLDMQVMLDAMWAHLLPALRESAPDVGAQEQLSARLLGLELPAYRADEGPSDWTPWLGYPFQVAPWQGEPQAQPLLTSIQLDRKDGELQVTLHEPDNALTLAVRTRGWNVSVPGDRFGKGIPVAAAGGWSDPKTLRLEVIFLETPHRMDIVCSLEDRRANVAWRLPPLGAAELKNLRNPI